MKPLPHPGTNHEKFYNPHEMVEKLLRKARSKLPNPHSNLRRVTEIEVPWWLLDKLVEQMSPTNRIWATQSGQEFFTYKGVRLKGVDK